MLRDSVTLVNVGCSSASGAKALRDALALTLSQRERELHDEEAEASSEPFDEPNRAERG